MAESFYAPMADDGLEGFSRIQSRAKERTASAAALWADVLTGKAPNYYLKEAIRPRNPIVLRAIANNYPGIIQLSETHTRSDFTNLTANVLGRMAIAGYRDFPSPWRQYARVTANLQDFRPITRFPMNGLEGPWPEQMEDAELAYGSMSEGTAVQIVPRKYALGIRWSWELILQDDLGIWDTVPDRLGRGGARTVNRAVTDVFVGPNGPDTAIYTAGNKNLVTGNPVLSVASLATAWGMLRGQTDTQGQPIMVEAAVLVVPPALEVVARNILNATTIRMTSAGGASGQEIETTNWIGSSLSLAVDPYIPIIASSANGSTSWFLFAAPSTGNPAIEVAFIAGYQEPVIYIKQANTIRVGGGIDQEAGDWYTMSQDYKGMVAFGTGLVDVKGTVGSNGSGT